MNIVEPQEAVASGDIEVAQIQVAPEQMHVWRTEVMRDAALVFLSKIPLQTFGQRGTTVSLQRTNCIHWIGMR